MRGPIRRIGAACALALTLAACNQTAGPAMTPLSVPTGPGGAARVALADAERTRAAQQAQLAAYDVVTILDPTGLSEVARPLIELEHQRVLDEKYRRVGEEVERAVAEAEAARDRTPVPNPRGRR